MKNWYLIPEIVGCNATLRLAAMQAVDAVEQGRHFVVEGEPGSGRRLLARSAWCRRSPGARSLFTLDCRMFRCDGAEALLFGERSSSGIPSTIHLGKLNLAAGGGLLLLHAECLPLKTQSRLAQAIGQSLLRPPSDSVQLLVTCTPPVHVPVSLHSDLDRLLLRVHVPALCERVEDIRAIAESFLRSASPFERVRCSQALIDRFCAYDWPGNVTELRSVLRHLLLQPHNGLLDVGHLADLMYRDETCFALLQGGHRPSHIEDASAYRQLSTESRSMQ
jgi:Nif-specific regulatory protein